MILRFGLLFTRAEAGDVANLLCFKILLSMSWTRHHSLVINFNFFIVLVVSQSLFVLVHLLRVLKSAT